MHRSVSRFASAVAVAGITVLFSGAAHAQRPADIGIRPAAIDTIAANLVDLELERITLVVASGPSTALARHVSEQIGALRARLHALPDHASAERIVAERLVLAFDARVTRLSAQLQQFRLMYTEAHPTVLRTIEEERLLDQRRTEIRSSI